MFELKFNLKLIKLVFFLCFEVSLKTTSGKKELLTYPVTAMARFLFKDQ